jgi:hypothetical protein
MKTRIIFSLTEPDALDAVYQYGVKSHVDAIFFA